MKKDNANVSVALSVSDPQLLKAKKLLDETRTAILSLIKYSFTIKAVKQEFLPFLIILYRMGQTVSSIELLLYSKLERDAATLLLTLMELRYDALYIAIDLERAKTWLKHDKENTKPWKVKDLINQLFKDKNERDAEFNLYRKCSMKKHGNPFGGTETFPLGIQDGWLVFMPSQFDPKMITSYILWGCAECEAVAQKTIETFEREGLNVTDIKDQFEAIKRLRSIMMEVNIKELIVELLKQQAAKAAQGNNSANAK